MKDISRIPRSFMYAVKGLRHAYKTDKSFRLEVKLGLPIYIIIGWLIWPLAEWEILLFVLSYALILTVELINTAFEKMLDRVHPDEHELIGRSKDIAAAAVLVVFLFAFFVILLLLYTHLFAHTFSSLASPFV